MSSSEVLWYPLRLNARAAARMTASRLSSRSRSRSRLPRQGEGLAAVLLPAVKELVRRLFMAAGVL